MSTIYHMARTPEDLADSPLTAYSLDDLAACFTDAREPEYDGPTPAPGQTVRGIVLARDPRKSSIGPKTVRIGVWVTASTV